jgi:hypothetical protein
VPRRQPAWRNMHAQEWYGRIPLVTCCSASSIKRSTSTGMEDSDTLHFREPDRLAARPSWVSCKITITKMIMTRTPILSPMIPRFTSPPPFDSDGCFCCEASPTLCMAAILAPSTLNHPKGGCITPLKRFKGVSERSPRLPPDQRRNRTLARRALTGPSAMRDPSPESIGRDDIGKAAHDRQPSWPLWRSWSHFCRSPRWSRL